MLEHIPGLFLVDTLNHRGEPAQMDLGLLLVTAIPATWLYWRVFPKAGIVTACILLSLLFLAVSNTALAVRDAHVHCPSF